MNRNDPLDLNYLDFINKTGKLFLVLYRLQN